MKSLPDSLVQHLSGFLQRSDSVNFACTAKRFKNNLDEAYFNVLVWRRHNVEETVGCAVCGEEYKVWSSASKMELLKRLMADPLIVRIRLRARSYNKYYKRREWFDPWRVDFIRRGLVPAETDIELFD